MAINTNRRNKTITTSYINYQKYCYYLPSYLKRPEIEYVMQ